MEEAVSQCKESHCSAEPLSRGCDSSRSWEWGLGQVGVQGRAGGAGRGDGRATHRPWKPLTGWSKRLQSGHCDLKLPESKWAAARLGVDAVSLALKGLPKSVTAEL